MGGRGEYWLPCPALNCIELNWVPEWVVLQGFVMLGFQDIFSLWGNLKTKCRMDGNIIWTIQTLSFFTKLYKHMILKHDFNTCFFFYWITICKNNNNQADIFTFEIRVILTVYIDDVQLCYWSRSVYGHTEWTQEEEKTRIEFIIFFIYLIFNDFS